MGREKSNKKTSSYFRPDISEKEVVGFIQGNLGGDREVFLNYGHADLVVDQTIIEVKKWGNWKELLGQMLVHKTVNPHRPIRGVLFCRDRTFPPYNKPFVEMVFDYYGFSIWVVTDEFIRRHLSDGSTEDPR